MKRLMILAVLVAALGAYVMPSYSQEVISLTSPVAVPARSTYRVRALHIDFVARSVSVTVSDNNGVLMGIPYPTPVPISHPSQPTGATLINTLNTANLTSNSLTKRILTRLQTDGYIPAGSVTGTPE